MTKKIALFLFFLCCIFNYAPQCGAYSKKAEDLKAKISKTIDSSGLKSCEQEMKAGNFNEDDMKILKSALLKSMDDFDFFKKDFSTDIGKFLYHIKVFGIDVGQPTAEYQSCFGTKDFESFERFFAEIAHDSSIDLSQLAGNNKRLMKIFRHF
jgi:hypothetical protein